MTYNISHLSKGFLYGAYDPREANNVVRFGLSIYRFGLESRGWLRVSLAVKQFEQGTSEKIIFKKNVSNLGEIYFKISFLSRYLERLVRSLVYLPLDLIA